MQAPSRLQFIAIGGVVVLAVLLFLARNKPIPDPADTRLNAALTILDTNIRSEEGMKALMAVDADFPNHERTKYEIGLIHYNRQETDKALDWFYQALSLGDEYRLAHFYIGTIYSKRFQPDSALYHYRKYQTNLSNAQDLEVLEGYIGGELSRYLSLLPSDSRDERELKRLMENIYLGRGQPMESVLELRQFAETTQMPQAYFELAKLAISTGQWEKAIERFEIALKLEPDMQEVYPGLAHAYVQIGEKEKALGLYNTYLKLIRNPSERKEIEAAIERIKIN